jgi:hypothetical protein
MPREFQRIRSAYPRLSSSRRMNVTVDFKGWNHVRTVAAGKSKDEYVEHEIPDKRLRRTVILGSFEAMLSGFIQRNKLAIDDHFIR